MIVRIDDVFRLQMGKTPSRKRPDYWRDGKYDWVSIADLGTYDKYTGATKEQINELGIKESGIKAAPANTVLMSFKLSLGKTAITTRETFTNEAIMAFIDKDEYEVNPEFVFHQFRTKDWMVGTNRAVMGATLNKGTLSECSMYLPSAEKQNKIVANLDYVQDLIGIQKRQFEKLEDLVKSRFVEMFWDRTFPEVTVGDVFRTSSGGTPSSKEPLYYDGGNIPWLTSGEVDQDRIESTAKCITQLGFDKSSAKWTPADSIVIAMYGATAGKSGLLAIEATMNQAVCALWPNENFIPEYLLHAVRCQESWIIEQTAGGAQPNISQAIIKRMQLKMPPLDMQESFAKFVQQVDVLKSQTQQSADKLQELYDSLAQEYFGGGEA